jgi:hypothetical protein
MRRDVTADVTILHVGKQAAPMLVDATVTIIIIIHCVLLTANARSHMKMLTSANVVINNKIIFIL